MPQLSLYIDKETLSKIEMAAKIEKLSLSKWVVSKLKDTLKHSWPDDYELLFGSITDDSFSPDRTEKLEDDVPREEF
jgi:hypothetical protein